MAIMSAPGLRIKTTLAGSVSLFQLVCQKARLSDDSLSLSYETSGTVCWATRNRTGWLNQCNHCNQCTWYPCETHHHPTVRVVQAIPMLWLALLTSYNKRPVLYSTYNSTQYCTLHCLVAKYVLHVPNPKKPRPKMLRARYSIRDGSRLPEKGYSTVHTWTHQELVA